MPPLVPIERMNKNFPQVQYVAASHTIRSQTFIRSSIEVQIVCLLIFLNSPDNPKNPSYQLTKPDRFFLIEMLDVISFYKETRHLMMSGFSVSVFSIISHHKSITISII